MIVAFIARGPVDRPDTALAKKFDDTVASKIHAYEGLRLRAFHQSDAGCDRRLLDEPARVIARCEESFYFGTQFTIGPACRREEAGPVLRWELQRTAEQFLHPRPVVFFKLRARTGSPKNMDFLHYAPVGV